MFVHEIGLTSSFFVYLTFQYMPFGRGVQLLGRRTSNDMLVFLGMKAPSRLEYLPLVGWVAFWEDFAILNMEAPVWPSPV